MVSNTYISPLLWVTRFPVCSIPLCMFLLQCGWTLNERSMPGGMNELLLFTGCVFNSVTKKVQAVYICVRALMCFCVCVCAQTTLWWGVCVRPASPVCLSVAPGFTWHQSKCGEIVISFQASCYWLKPATTGTSTMRPISPPHCESHQPPQPNNPPSLHLNLQFSFPLFFYFTPLSPTFPVPVALLPSNSPLPPLHLSLTPLTSLPLSFSPYIIPPLRFLFWRCCSPSASEPQASTP